MSGVVLRCPNCGTTKATPGECEACHEADVRFFCTNHTPGHWLSAPVCPACGARFGERTSPTPSRPAERRTESPRRSPAPPKRPSRTSRPADSDPGPADEEWPGPWGDEDRETPPRRTETREPVVVRLPDLLRMRRRTPPAADPLYMPDPARAGLALGGCLVRAIFLGFFLLIALFLGGLLLGGSLLQGLGFIVY